MLQGQSLSARIRYFYINTLNTTTMKYPPLKYLVLQFLTAGVMMALALAMHNA